MQRPLWSPLGVKFKISDEHPRLFRMGVPPPPRDPCEPVRRVNHRKVFVYLANPCIATYPKGKLSHS